MRFGDLYVDTMAGLFFFYGMSFALVGVRQVFKVFTNRVLVQFGFAPKLGGALFRAGRLHQHAHHCLLRRSAPGVMVLALVGFKGCSR